MYRVPLGILNSGVYIYICIFRGESGLPHMKTTARMFLELEGNLVSDLRCRATIFHG